MAAAVERGEETIAPAMRETCIRQSSLQEGTISPADEVSLPSLNDEDAVLPPPPADFESSGSDLLESPTESAPVPDDETLQRVATQVTNQAVQEAIRLVTENGLGGSSNSNTPSSDNNSLPSPLSSPASPDNQATAQGNLNLLDFRDDVSGLPPPMPQSPEHLVPSPPSPATSPVEPSPPLPCPPPKAAEIESGVATSPPAPAQEAAVSNGNTGNPETDSSATASEALI